MFFNTPMFKQTSLIILGVILVAGAFTIAQANAQTFKGQPLKSLQCDTAKDCKIIFVNPKGDIEVAVTNTANASSGGGSGGGPAVDQTARDGVTALQNADNGQNKEIQNLKGNLSLAQDGVNAANIELTAQNATITELQTQVANLTEQLKNVITDVNVSNQTTGGSGGNTTTPGPGDNSTGGVTPPTNDTGGVVPPVNDTGSGGGNSTGNSTGGNTTDTGGNQTG